MAVVPLNIAPIMGRSPMGQHKSEGTEKDAAGRPEKLQGQPGTSGKCRQGTELGHSEGNLCCQLKSMPQTMELLSELYENDSNFNILVKESPYLNDC